MIAGLVMVYAAALFIIAWMCILMLLSGTRHEKRDAARVLILSPVWPILLLWWLVVAVRYLWRTADFRNKRT